MTHSHLVGICLVGIFRGDSIEHNLICCELIAGHTKLTSVAIKWKIMKTHCTHELHICHHGIQELDRVIVLLHSEAPQGGHPVHPLELLHVVDVEVRGPDAINKLIVHFHTAGFLGCGEVESIVMPGEQHDDVDVDGEVPLVHLVNLHQEHLGVNVDRLLPRQVHLVVVGRQTDAARTGGSKCTGAQQSNADCTHCKEHLTHF